MQLQSIIALALSATAVSAAPSPQGLAGRDLGPCPPWGVWGVVDGHCGLYGPTYSATCRMRGGPVWSVWPGMLSCDSEWFQTQEKWSKFYNCNENWDDATCAGVPRVSHDPIFASS
ncbi:hypothetical protein PspLS_01636 [Pyricularia sp. CBS 133598]|nr:hypothetical protein PspLS_01636 [Pyricularia sp. CBS 133598]